MMNKKNLPHIITVTAFVVFIVLGLASASAPDQSETQPSLYYAEDYYNRAQENVKKGNYELAIEDYTAVIRIGSSRNHAGWTSAGYNDRAWTYAYHMKTNFDQAITDATQAIKLSPNDANYYDTRSWAYLGKGDYDRAIADAIQAIKLSPNNANYLNTRGWAYLGKGDYNHANDDFLKALQLNPNIDSSKEGLKKIREAQAEEVIDWSQFE